MSASATTFPQSFSDGTKADLQTGDVIAMGYEASRASERQASSRGWTCCRAGGRNQVWYYDGKLHRDDGPGCRRPAQPRAT